MLVQWDILTRVITIFARITGCTLCFIGQSLSVGVGSSGAGSGVTWPLRTVTPSCTDGLLRAVWLELTVVSENTENYQYCYIHCTSRQKENLKTYPYNATLKHVIYIWGVLTQHHRVHWGPSGWSVGSSYPGDTEHSPPHPADLWNYCMFPLDRAPG